MKIKCLLLAYSIIIFACTSNEKILPELFFYNDNALLPTISFKTGNTAEVFIEYWPYNDGKRKQHSKVSTGEDHRLTLFGVKPTTKYYYRIHNKTAGSTSEEFSFMTNVLPNEMLEVEKIIIDTTQFSGYILIRKIGTVSADVMLDKHGDIVWYHQYDTIVGTPFTLTRNNTILSSYSTNRIVEFDMYGDLLSDINLSHQGIKKTIRDEIVMNDKNEIVALTSDTINMIQENVTQYILADGIIRLNSAGKKEWEWNVMDAFDAHLNKVKNLISNQALGDANSVTIDRDSHYLVSFGNISQIWKINSEDGTVIWKLGENGDFRMDKDDYFIGRSNIHFNQWNELMVFDNSENAVRSTSRILSFKLNEEKMEAISSLQIVLPKELSAPKMCSVQRIDEDKLLVCNASKNGAIAVINEKSEILWKANLSPPSSRAYYIEKPFWDPN